MGGAAGLRWLRGMRDPWQGDPIVALCGSHDPLKRDVFNALTGLSQRTANWPGCGVAWSEGAFTHRGWRFRLLAMPGDYALLPLSEEEEMARAFLLLTRPDVTVLLADECCLQRALGLARAARRLSPRTCLGVNLASGARREGWEIDLKRLAREMESPVVPMAAAGGEGLERLKDTIVDLAGGTYPPSPKILPIEPEVARAVEVCAPEVRAPLPAALSRAAGWVALLGSFLDAAGSRLFGPR